VLIQFFRRSLRKFVHFLPLSLRQEIGCIFALQRWDFTYASDGLLTVHNSDFLREASFLDAYSTGKATHSWGQDDIAWRAHVCCWAASSALRLDGDFVECGVNRGGLSATVMRFIDFANVDKTFYLLDTFQGLVERYSSVTERENQLQRGGYQDCLEDVRSTFSQYDNVKIVPGAVPETLPLVSTDRIAYLSIDMNCVEPEIAAISYFWDKLVPGAIVVLDDYGVTMHIAQKLAFDSFAKQMGTSVLSLPTGQGLILKV